MTKHHSFRLTQSELPRKIMALRFHVTRARLLALLGVAAVYCLLWLVTGFFGIQQAHAIALHQMRDFLATWTDISNMPTTPPKGPAYYFRASAYAPFLIRSDYDWVSGPLAGGGGSSWYFWFLGTLIHLHRFDQIWMA